MVNNKNNYCIHDPNKDCKGIQVITKERSLCCDELDEITLDTAAEIIKTFDDIIDNYHSTFNTDILFYRGLNQLSYLTGVLPTESSEQNEIILILKDLVIQFKVNDYNKNDFKDTFYDLIKYTKAWLRVEYLHDNSVADFNFLDKLLTIFHIVNERLNPQEVDLDDLFF